MADLPFQETLAVLKSLVPPQLFRPQLGIVCGSGLGGLVDNLRDVVQVPYENLPGFVKSTGM